MTYSRQFFFVLVILAATAVFTTACSPSLKLKIQPDVSGTALFNTEMSPTADTLVRRFSGLGGTSTETPIFDKNKIIYSLARAGIKVDSLTFPSRTALALSLSFLKLDGLLDQALAVKKEARTISVTISVESVNAAVDLLPPDTRDYLNLLMAPIFTGEKRNRAEYEADIGATYGPTLAEELKKSVFSLTIDCPYPVQNAQITSPGLCESADSRAVFTIPLSELLAMEKPFTALAEW